MDADSTLILSFLTHTWFPNSWDASFELNFFVSHESGRGESSSYLRPNQHPDVALCRHSRLFSTNSRLTVEHLILQPSSVPAVQSAASSTIRILTQCTLPKHFQNKERRPLVLHWPVIYSQMISCSHFSVSHRRLCTFRVSLGIGCHICLQSTWWSCRAV